MSDQTLSDNDLLNKCILFSALDQSGQRELASKTTRAHFAAGSSIFHLGDSGQSMMVVLVGVVRIFLPTRQGKDVILVDLARGAIFGEVALLDGLPRSASAMALTNCDVLSVRRSDVLAFLKTRADACLAIIDILCGRLRRADERMTDIGLGHVSVRLAKVLLERTTAATELQKIRVSQSDLGDMVGSSRESVNRTLRQWHRQGIVQFDAGLICVARRDALTALAECA